MKHAHEATPETQSRIYEYCECGAVRHLTARGYDDWHVCDLCRIPILNPASIKELEAK